MNDRVKLAGVDDRPLFTQRKPCPPRVQSIVLKDTLVLLSAQTNITVNSPRGLGYTVETGTSRPWYRVGMIIISHRGHSRLPCAYDHSDHRTDAFAYRYIIAERRYVETTGQRLRDCFNFTYTDCRQLAALDIGQHFISCH